MKRTVWKRSAAVCILSSLLGAGAALAAGNPLDERVNLSLVDAEPEETFRAFGQMMGVEVVVDPGVTGKVTVTLQKVRVRTLLDAVCESIGCRWDLEDKKLRVTSTSTDKPAPVIREALDSAIDLKVTKADARELLQTFGQIMGVEVSLDPAITGKVSLELEKTPVRQALDTVCLSLGCDWEMSDGGGKMTLKVTAKPKRAK
jgi:type II secretory pathway component GspD/PulD (secretin)